MAIDVELKAPKQGNVTWPSTFLTSNRFPIVANRVFATLANAQAYVNDTAIDASAYPGIILAVIRDVEDKNGVYYVKSIPTKEGEAGELVKVGSNSGTPISSVDTYVLEFSIEDLLGLASGNIVSLADFNINNLRQAVIDNKVVLINYYTTHGAAIPCACYSEDTDAEFRIEIVLEGRLIKVSIDLNEVEDGIATVTSKDITITELQEKLKSGENIKTINGNSILGKGDISTSTILDFTVEDVYHAHQEDTDLLGIETKSIVTDIDNKEQIYIHYDEQKQGIIPCGTYHGDEGYYYILFIADNNVFKLHIKDADQTVYIDSVINLEDIKAEITVDDQLSEGSPNPVQNKVITTELKKKANADAIPTRLLQLTNDANYATTTYVDGKIPTKTSELTNNSGFITSEEAQRDYQPKGNYLTEIPSEYITEEEVDDELSDTSENPVQNKVINAELKKKIEGEIEYVLSVSGMGVVPKDLVLSTPSGDPMHYMYIAAGADYNATESDIEVPGEYGDTIIHKRGCWYLNEVGDLTNEEMRLIYEDGFHTRKPNGGYPMFFQDLEYRTFLNRTDFQDPVRTTYSFSYCTKAVVIRIGKNTTTIYQPTGMFNNCEYVIKILGVMRCAPQITDLEIEGMFNGCYALQEVKLKDLHRSISLEYSSNISKNSILYMISNAVISENRITITLHEDAYNRLIDDEEINNAINAHGNIALSKPENN